MQFRPPVSHCPDLWLARAIVTRRSWFDCFVVLSVSLVLLVAGVRSEAYAISHTLKAALAAISCHGRLCMLLPRLRKKSGGRLSWCLGLAHRLAAVRDDLFVHGTACQTPPSSDPSIYFPRSSTFRILAPFFTHQLLIRINYLTSHREHTCLSLTPRPIDRKPLDRHNRLTPSRQSTTFTRIVTKRRGQSAVAADKHHVKRHRPQCWRCALTTSHV